MFIYVNFWESVSYDDNQWPSGLVVEELQVVSLHVQQTTDHHDKQDDEQKTGVVGWTKYFDLLLGENRIRHKW